MPKPHPSSSPIKTKQKTHVACVQTEISSNTAFNIFMVYAVVEVTAEWIINQREMVCPGIKNQEID